MTYRAAQRAFAAKAASLFAVVTLALGAGGCTPAQYAKIADTDAYKVNAQKQRQALGDTHPFDITYRPVAVGVEGIGPVGNTVTVSASQPARELSLEDALEIAARNSRSFQTQKEVLYSSALALANLRHQWSLLSGTVTGTTGITGIGGDEPVYDGSTLGTVSFAQKFANGGIATVGLGLNAATDFLGLGGTTLGSFVNANFTQPLLQGAWHDFAYEQLYRAERDFAIQILSYEFYVQGFSVGIAQSYYNVLELRNVFENDQENLRRLEDTFKFVQAQVAGGMISRVQSDQAEQDVLNAKDRIEVSRQAYNDALDQFKITLGLPLATNVELRMAELEELSPQPIPFEEDRAIASALSSRPDVLTSYAKLRDAKRDVEIAANNFLPELDLVLAALVPSTDSPNRRPLDIEFPQSTRSVRMNFSYQLDQTDNMDAYRNAQIAADRRTRDLAEFLDNVRLNVRNSYRSLVQSRASYEIQKSSYALAIRRTKLARFEQQEGLASTRDVLDAEDALRTSKNLMIAALVSYTTTRLNFLVGVGMIDVDAQGKFHERSTPTTTDRLGYYR